MWTDNNYCLQINGISFAGAFSEIWERSAKLYFTFFWCFWQHQLLPVWLRSLWCSFTRRDFNVLSLGLQGKPVQELMKKETFYLLWDITHHENLSWNCWAQKQGFWQSWRFFLLFIDGHKTNSTDLKTVLHKSEPPWVNPRVQEVQVLK